MVLVIQYSPLLILTSSFNALVPETLWVELLLRPGSITRGYLHPPDPKLERGQLPVPKPKTNDSYSEIQSIYQATFEAFLRTQNRTGIHSCHHSAWCSQSKQRTQRKTDAKAAFSRKSQLVTGSWVNLHSFVPPARRNSICAKFATVHTN